MIGQFPVSLHTAEIAHVMDGSMSRSSPRIILVVALTWQEPRHSLWLMFRGDQDWLDKAVNIVFYHLLILFSQLPSLSYLES